MLKPNDEHCNVEEMLRVRSLILDASDDEFDMAEWCGTACCIAGWAVKSRGYDAGEARIVLGLTSDQAYALFMADSDCGQHDLLSRDITREQAAQAIDNVIADGMPHWQDIL